MRSLPFQKVLWRQRQTRGMPRRVQVRGKRRAVMNEETEEDSEKVTSSVEDESEGSLADFIEHDSAELDAQDDGSYEQESGAAASSHDEEDGEDDTVATEEDPDDAIRAQYTADLEQCGSIVNDQGVRRSARANKGKAPTRYVDEEYAELMLEDLTPADRAQLERELSSSDQWDDDASGNNFTDSTDESSF